MVTTTLITAQQVADARDRVTFLPRQGVLVRGLYNQVLLRDVTTMDDVLAQLAALGYQPTREWLPGGNGSQESYIHRAA